MRPTIDWRLQLAAIVLAEELHCGRAAQRLHIAVSIPSKRIALLEEKRWFIRFVLNSKAVELTEVSWACVEEARASLPHAKRAVNITRAPQQGARGHSLGRPTPYSDAIFQRTRDDAVILGAKEQSGKTMEQSVQY